MITLVKLGGSLITDKTQRATFRPDVMQRIAREIQSALVEKPDLQIVIGHGSGSFGHFEAAEHDTIHGVQTSAQWRGFARVATIASELNYLVTRELHSADVPALRVQPSASSVAQAGVIVHMALSSIERALAHGLVPLVYGDVAFDDIRGGTITSTETIFAYLVNQLPVSRLLLLGEVDGVYDEEERVIPQITPDNFDSIRAALGGSSGVDVTGGMLTKVQEMLRLATHPPYPVVHILNGKTPNALYEMLLAEAAHGTRISR